MPALGDGLCAVPSLRKKAKTLDSRLKMSGMTRETVSLSLLRSEVNADCHFSIDKLVPVHLGIEDPLVERMHAGQIEPPIFCGHQHAERSLRRFADEKAGFHPVVDFLPLQLPRHGRPRGVLGDRTKLLILVQLQSMYVHGFKDIHLFILHTIRLMVEASTWLHANGGLIASTALIITGNILTGGIL